MAYQFDFENSLIEVIIPQSEVTIQELINEIRTAEQTEEGVQYPKIADASGKASLGGGIAVGITVELLGNWQLKFWTGNYIAKISGGNLVGGPSDDPVAYSAGVQVLLIQAAASTVVTLSTGSSLSSEEHSKLMSLPAPAAIWAENQAGEKLNFLHNIEGGNWTLVGDQMVFFDVNNNEIARFDLFDAEGNATIENVFSRVRI